MRSCVKREKKRKKTLRKKLRNEKEKRRKVWTKVKMQGKKMCVYKCEFLPGEKYETGKTAGIYQRKKTEKKKM